MAANDLVQANFNLTRRQHIALQGLSKRTRIPMTFLIREAVDQYLAKKKEKVL